MLQLPASIRAAVALHLYTKPLLHATTPRPVLWGDIGAIWSQGCRPRPGLVKRAYATILEHESAAMWRENDKNSAESTVLQNHSTSSEDTEAAELTSALLELARLKGNRTNRKKLRRSVRQAVQSEDALASLRHMMQARSSKGVKLDPSAAGSRKDPPQDSAIEADITVPNDAIQLIDVEYIQRTMPLPTKDQYAFALDDLFDPLRVAVAINNQCHKRRLSEQIVVDFAAKQGLSKATLKQLNSNGNEVVVCTLKLEITGLCTITAIGEALSKQRARQAAWLHVLSKMHVSGKLKELFPDQPTTITNDEMLADADDIESKLVEVAAKMVEAEKDAKIEIFEYAASLGLIPEWEAIRLQPRTRARLGRTAKMPAPVWQVSIRLEGRDIKISAIGKDIRSAEVAASFSFKGEAAKKHGSLGDASRLSNRRVLTVGNVKQFFEFYRSRARRTSVAIEHEDHSQRGVNGNIARVIVDGTQVGRDVYMSKKVEAESLAQLTAAVELTNADPALLREFEQTLVKGKTKVLRSVKSIDLPVEVDVMESMREALLEARTAGLSDVRKMLGAEDYGSAQRIYPPMRRLSPPELARASEVLLTKQSQFGIDLRSKKAALPMSQRREELLNMVKGNQYSIIVGATGSGKTTQVPQILFENAILAGQGASCNIICTQPRRIAATSVAERVAAERNEPLRETVGHQVRFDSKPPYDPYGITYCTTGVLLEKLKHDPDDVLDTVTHICIDEVHERDMQIDFLMIILKQAVKARQSEGKTVPKIVLMSATLDTDLFANYFGTVDDRGALVPCPSISVPGRTFPVTNSYLGSIMADMHEKHGSEVDVMLSAHPDSLAYMSSEEVFTATCNSESFNGNQKSTIDWKGAFSKPLNEAEADARKEKEEALVPVALVAATIAHISKTREDGAILAFLPGLAEILDTEQRLKNYNLLGLRFSDESRFRVFPLHSTSTREQQAEIFKPLPPGCRKIILATNIAETSVTVADVKYVVDSGKLREVRYDHLRRITKLQCVWVSKSNAKQRAGRAGRVQDGYYYALYSKERSESLEVIGQPELLRSDLQETCLSIKAQNFGGSVESFLAQAIQAPNPEAVNGAMQNLVDIEAITPTEALTPLGRVLSRLPVHPSLGKMIILGVIFRCLDPMIILGAAVEARSMFVAPLDLRAEADAAHKSYATHEYSDQLAYLEAFRELRMLKYQYGVQAAKQRAVESFLHWGAFQSIDRAARQIEEVLMDCGLIPTSRDYMRESAQSCGPAYLNQNGQNSALIKSLLVAGLSPNIAVKTSDDGVMYRTGKEASVSIHPRSQNSELKKSDLKHTSGTLFTYGELAKSVTDHLFLRETTQITPLMALLFGGQLELTRNGILERNEWLPFFVKSTDRQFASRLILEFRKGLDRVLYRAFDSLKDLTPGSGGQFVDDPIQEKFV